MTCPPLKIFTIAFTSLAETGDAIRIEVTDECGDDWTEFTFESTDKIKHKKTGKCLAQRDDGNEVKRKILELINDCNNSSHTSWKVKEYPPNKGRLMNFIDSSPSPTSIS